MLEQVFAAIYDEIAAHIDFFGSAGNASTPSTGR